MPEALRIWFDHGCGDCVHFAHLLQVYKAHGYQVAVHYEQNKAPIFQAADIPYTHLEGSAYHAWAYYPGFNLPAPSLDGSGNKIWLNLGKPPLPDIGPVWEELCQVNLEGAPEKLMTPELEADAESFLRDLPRPVVLIHPQGTNMPAAKNIPRDTTEELYRLLLERTEGSLVLLDWDFRIPELPHGRVRHVKRDWGHLSLLQLYAIMRRSDLLIGVDSGPAHFAAMVRGLPVLLVCHHHYPTCVTLPSAKMVCLTRNADSYRPVNQARRKRWNVVEYAGVYPTAEDIGRNALRLLEGSRYGLPLARDVMMQQWVRDWSRSSTSLSPWADRNRSFDRLFRELRARFPAPVIVETGCVRSLEDWSAGYSTYLFAAYLDGRPGKLVSVDIDQRNLDFARSVGWGGNYVCSDSVSYLRSCAERIDCLYLDSMDADLPGHAEHGLAEIQAAEDKLTDRALVVYDDTIWREKAWRGKGALGVPYLLNKGWRVLFSGYQTILTR